MILAILRPLLIGFAVLTVIYVVLSLYSRSLRKQKLEREWDEEGRSGDRDAYVEAGLEDYRHSLRRRLLLLVYVVPLLLIAVILYVVNFM
jgi:Ca2+/Na+ antiporter